MKKIFIFIFVALAAMSFTACEKTNYRHPMYRGK